MYLNVLQSGFSNAVDTMWKQGGISGDFLGAEYTFFYRHLGRLGMIRLVRNAKINTFTPTTPSPS